MKDGFLKSLGEFISNKEIDKRYDLLIQFGVEGGRLLGAGMSGFLMVMVRQENQLSFWKSCTEETYHLNG